MAIEEKEEQTTSLKDLIELVEKDPLPSNVFTIEDKDPMVILGKLNEVIAYLKNLQATINSSDSKANQALENAIKALSSASESLQASTTALNSSNKALETANLAIDTANTSLEGSNQAKTSSNEALAKANNALQIAQEALNQVTESLGSKVYDNHGNLMNNVKFAGHNGINVDMAEDNETFDIRLDEDITKAIEDNHTAIEQTKSQAQANAEDIVNITDMLAGVEEKVETELPNRLSNVESNLSEINPKVARALLTPMSAPNELKLVGIDTSNNQEMLNVGEGLEIENGEIKIDDNIVRCDEIYNKNSNDYNVNWGYTSGIASGTIATNNIMGEYRFLDVVMTIYPHGSLNTGGWSGVYRVDITSKYEGESWCVAGYAISYSDGTHAGSVNKSTWNITILYNHVDKSIQCRCSFNGATYTPSTAVYISKIYGVK